MATIFDRWKKDPFFSAAEEVQESADRMESAYRNWLHEMKTSTSDPSFDLRRDLHTALGTTKWQLEELERAVKLNDDACAAGEDTRARHNQFVEAISDRITAVEDSLKGSGIQKDSKLTWVRLDQGECDELALFLGCPGLLKGKPPVISSVGIVERGNQTITNDEKRSPLCNSVDIGSGIVRNAEKGKPPVIPSVGIVEGYSRVLGNHENIGTDLMICCNPKLSYNNKEKTNGHRRTASASPDIEAWKIVLPVEDERQHNGLPPKVPSFTCLSKVMESTSKVSWPNYGFRKWRGGDQTEESIPLQNHQLPQGIGACYERSKDCLSDCADDTYDKELYGWAGALHRQLRRSQYHIQYRRPLQTIFWAVLLVLLIILFATSAI